MWKEREPEFARRREVPLDGVEGRKVLRQAELDLAAEPAPETPIELVEDAVGALTGHDDDDGDDGGDGGDGGDDEDAKRERRRQRRRTRPHGRAR
jgi:hypothetical protein